MKNILTLFLTITIVIANAQIKCVSIYPDKMNVFYVGVDNPLSIAVSGVNSNDIEVSISGVEGASISGENSKYFVRATKPTTLNQFCYVNVKDKNSSQKHGMSRFRIKRIPDPQLRLTNNKNDATVSGEEMKAETGVFAVLENFDFEVQFKVLSYELIYISSGQEPLKNINEGSAFNEQSRKLIQMAKSGDIFIFRNIKGICSADQSHRNLQPLVITIK